MQYNLFYNSMKLECHSVEHLLHPRPHSLLKLNQTAQNVTLLYIIHLTMGRSEKKKNHRSTP